MRLGVLAVPVASRAGQSRGAVLAAVLCVGLAHAPPTYAQQPASPGSPEAAARCLAASHEWIPGDAGGPAGESVLACLERLGRGVIDTRIPSDQRYHLTTFGGPGDEQPVDCGDPRGADGTWYYTANKQRFECGTRIRLVDERRQRCVVVEVADTGPHICVEAASGRAAWDVSPLAAQHLFGVGQAGWSERRTVIGAPVPPSTPLGPCDAALQVAAEPAASGGAIGSRCESAQSCGFAEAECLDESMGWPEGYCSRPCSGACPESPGPHAQSVCSAAAGGTARCLAQCDYTLFESGCRSGYACARGAGEGEEAAVCVPAQRCEAAPPDSAASAR